MALLAVSPDRQVNEVTRMDGDGLSARGGDTLASPNDRYVIQESPSSARLPPRVQGRDGESSRSSSPPLLNSFRQVFETTRGGLDLAIERLESPMPHAQAIEEMVAVLRDKGTDKKRDKKDGLRSPGSPGAIISSGGGPAAAAGPAAGRPLQQLYQELQG